MITVVIANHDYERIAELQSLLDWNQFGCEIVGTYTCAQAAMEAIIRWHPNLVFLEQGLSDRNGIDLIKDIKKSGFLTDFVLTEPTGDFELARAAMQLGVQEYLIYPIEKHELKRVILKYTNQWHALETGEENEYLLHTRRLLRNVFMRDFINKKQDMIFSVEDINRRYSFTFKDDIFQIALIQINNLPAYAVETFLPTFVMEIRPYFDPVCHEMVPYIYGEDFLILIFNYDAHGEAPGRIPKLKQIIQDYIRDKHCEGTTCTIGYGCPERDINLLWRILETAEQAVFCGVLQGHGESYCYERMRTNSGVLENICTPAFEKKLDYDTEFLDPKRFEARFRDAVSRAGEYMDSATLIELCHMAYRSVNKVCSAGAEIDRTLEWKTFMYDLCKCRSVNHVTLQVIRWTDEQFRAAKMRSRVPRPIRDAQEYIRQNCGDTITLQKTAEHVHLNASYLSMMFKKETGKNYTEFLTECRIDEAKRLLRETSFSVERICSEVGYIDKEHFSKLFARYVGMNPSVYRTLHN